MIGHVKLRWCFNAIKHALNDIPHCFLTALANHRSCQLCGSCLLFQACITPRRYLKCCAVEVSSMTSRENRSLHCWIVPQSNTLIIFLKLLISPWHLKGLTFWNYFTASYSTAAYLFCPPNREKGATYFNSKKKTWTEVPIHLPITAITPRLCLSSLRWQVGVFSTV